jgi:surface antigen
MKKVAIISILLMFLGSLTALVFHNTGATSPRKIGTPVDSLNRVMVYYNGSVSNVSGRNTTRDGYNLGLKYQCVEFVKRYYYEHLNHKMPDSYGHAKDFYDKNLKDGAHNKRRNLHQYSNPGNHRPKVNDLLIFDATPFNKYGHVAIVSEVSDRHIEIIQQNPGPGAKSRERLRISHQNNQWEIHNSRVLGWLRKH